MIGEDVRTVIGDPDSIDSILDRSDGVLHGHDSLHHNLHLGVLAQPGNVLPGQGLVDQLRHIASQPGALGARLLGAGRMRASLAGEVAHSQVRRQSELVLDISFPSSPL